ncbi:MAG: VTT domain-containing protein [Bacillota bacterium]|nr:VTT domain-containing protein [Bacillota bacterium]
MNSLKKADGNMDLNKTKTEKKQKRLARIKLAIMILIIITIPCYAYFFHPELIQTIKDPDAIAAFIEEYKYAGIPIYLGMNVLQVICSLPGQVFHIAGGYVFGILPALVLAFAGVCIGSTCSYGIAHSIGRESVHVLFGEKKVTKLLDQVNSKKGAAILFCGYLIPGMPKDILNYVAGLSNIKYRPYIVMCMVGRLPGMIASIVVGNQVFDGNYKVAVIISVCVLIVCVVCLLKRHKLIAVFEKFYSKLTK